MTVPDLGVAGSRWYASVRTGHRELETGGLATRRVSTFVPSRLTHQRDRDGATSARKVPARDEDGIPLDGGEEEVEEIEEALDAASGSVAGTMIPSSGWVAVYPGDENNLCPWPIEECGPPPLRPPETTSRLTPSEVGLDLPESEWGTDTCHRDFIGTVWALLQRNVALVEWAGCMAGLTEKQIDCMTDAVMGTRGLFNEPIHLHLQPTPPCDGAMATPSDHRIVICLDRAKWANAVSIWCDACASQDDKDCALIAIASSLLHEVSHTCGTDDRYQDGNEYCSDAYLLGNAFAWAALQQYPNAMASSCCSIFGDPTEGVAPGSGRGLNPLKPSTCVSGCGASGNPGPTPTYPSVDPPARDEVQLATLLTPDWMYPL